MDLIFVSKHEMIQVGERVVPTKPNLALEIYDYIKSENKRMKGLLRTNKVEAKF